MFLGVQWDAWPWLLVIVALPPLALLRLLSWPRALSVALLAIALSGPRIGVDAGRVAVLVDVSDSVGVEAAAQARFTLAQSNGFLAEYWVFGADAAQVASFQDVDRTVAGGSTDLISALVAVASADIGRILLVSDGIDTRLGMERRLPTQVSGVPIDVMHVARQPNVRVEAIDAPVAYRVGERMDVGVTLAAHEVSQVDVEVFLNRESVWQDSISLTTDTAEIRVPVDAPDSLDASLRVVVRNESLPADSDDVLDVQFTRDRDQRILVLDDTSTAEILREAGLDVLEIQPEELSIPVTADAVILRGSASRFSSSQLEALRAFVDRGGGLLMTGGASSFGLGGWFRTPVEDVLPVGSDLQAEVEVPLVSMVMVIDRSLSMASGSPSKMSLAQRGAAEVVDLAFERDELGLLAFSDTAEWIFAPRAATSRGKLEMLDGIRSLASGGGTVLEPALTMAVRELQGSSAAVRHIILLSDGRLYEGSASPAPLSDLEAIAALGSSEGITLSTIAIGAEADAETLEALSQSGGGRFYQAFDVSTLPRIFASEAVTASRSLIRENPPSPNRMVHPLLEGSGTPPAPDAYVVTQRKSDAEVLWFWNADETLLSIGRYGLGRSAALTVDTSAWLGDLATWAPFSGVIADVVRWLAARPDPYAATIESPVGADEPARLVLRAVEDGAFKDGRTLVVRGGGIEVPLSNTGPGEYSVALPPRMAGVPLVVVEGSEVVARSRWATQNPELRFTDGAAFLDSLAAVTGGEVLDTDDVWNPIVQAVSSPLRAPLAALAVLILIVDLVARRFWRSQISAAR